MYQMRSSKQVTVKGKVVLLLSVMMTTQVIQVISSDDATDVLTQRNDEDTAKTGLGISGDDVLARGKRGVCPTSPVGQEPCIHCPDHDASSPDDHIPIHYEYTDENSATCTCPLCRVPMYMDGPCVCTPTGGEVSCIFPIRGINFMPHHNRCRVPYNCSQCPGNMVLIKECSIDQDSVCGCADGYFQNSATTCKTIPTCQKNYHADLTHRLDDEYTSYICVPCPNGYIQPKDNSSDRCYQEPLPVFNLEAAPTKHSPAETNETHTSDAPNNMKTIHQETAILVVLVVKLAIYFRNKCSTKQQRRRRRPRAIYNNGGVVIHV
ncbi:uncharacterized protein [Amphiura filiformis]|uniref:uncharacterized protein n=1 Tax=Amphiura filiformis TaxID=82378 RepID=UPI003B218B1D